MHTCTIWFRRIFTGARFEAQQIIPDREHNRGTKWRALSLGGEKFRLGRAREFLLRFSGQRRVQYGRERKRTEPKMAATFLVVNKDGGGEGKRDEREMAKRETVSLEKGKGC